MKEEARTLDEMESLISSAERSVMGAKPTSESKLEKAAQPKPGAFAPGRASSHKGEGWDDWNIEEIAPESQDEKNAKFITNTILIVAVALALLAAIYFQTDISRQDQRGKKSKNFDTVLKEQNAVMVSKFRIAEANSQEKKASKRPDNYISPKGPKIGNSSSVGGEKTSKGIPRVEHKPYVIRNGKKCILVN
jgi:hypothetical protein